LSNVNLQKLSNENSELRQKLNAAYQDNEQLKGRLAEVGNDIARKLAEAENRAVTYAN
jgi:hypothetical protein